jgi:hypothetical protein
MSYYDFSGLTRAQMRVLDFQGWERRDLHSKPSARTLRLLVDRGLVVVRPSRVGGKDVGAVIVPIPVHMAWCAHCEGATP